LLSFSVIAFMYDDVTARLKLVCSLPTIAPVLCY
jgi:hypothetical protein